MFSFRASIRRGRCYGFRRGFDPNGDMCVERGKPPNVLTDAIWRPLGFCKPESADQIPFYFVAAHGYTHEAREVARLMIAAGADVNTVSPDGLIPLTGAVTGRNEEMVKLLLEDRKSTR